MSNVIATVNDLLNVKKGWKTSEFYVALVPAVVVILNVFGVHVSNSATTHIVMIVAGAVASVYVAARTYLKTVHLGHVMSLEGLLAQLEHEAQKLGINVGAKPAPVSPSPVVEVPKTVS